MAGTIFGLGLSQRVTPNGLPEGAWRLYLYAAASDTPVTAYKDTGLTTGQEHPWPIQADAYGTMPAFWLADGSYRARGVSSDGSRVFFDMSSVLALGASSGAGGGGGTVDPNAIYATGDSMWQPIQGTRTGWVRDNGRTIGSSTSGATERANADCQNLFEYYWNTYSDTLCPVPGGRGVSASADWTANKQITTLDMRGRAPFGLDDMGNSAAGRLSNVPFTIGNATTAGATGGESTHTLTSSEVPATALTINQINLGTIHLDQAASYVIAGGAADYNLGGGGGPNALVSNPSITIPPFTPAGTVSGGGAQHNNMPLFALGTWFRKI